MVWVSFEVLSFLWVGGWRWIIWADHATGQIYREGCRRRRKVALVFATADDTAHSSPSDRSYAVSNTFMIMMLYIETWSRLYASYTHWIALLITAIWFLQTGEHSLSHEGRRVWHRYRWFWNVSDSEFDEASRSPYVSWLTHSIDQRQASPLVWWATALRCWEFRLCCSWSAQ